MRGKCKNRDVLILNYNTMYNCTLHFGYNNKFEFIKTNNNTVRLFKKNIDIEIPVEDFNKYFVEITN
jgi:hypothetical protein